MRRTGFLVSCGALLAVGCGGSGSDDVDLTLTSVPGFDGFVTNTGFVDVFTSSAIAVGDTDLSFGNVARGVVRFDRSAIPAGTTIERATLKLNHSVVTGTPYADLGNILVDHVDLGAAVDATDFAGGILTAQIGTLTTNSLLGEKSIDVTPEVQADHAAARPTSDFRLYFPIGSDADAADDYATFNDAENHLPGTVPVLIVTYRNP